MTIQRRWLPAILCWLVMMAAGARGDDTLARLSPQAPIAGFQPQAVYLDQAGRPRGASFTHARTGLLLRVLYFDSVPQLLIAVNTPPTSDKGEPHVHEHLVLGKGNAGRALMNASEMNLTVANAATYQWYTIYDFNAVTGLEAFYRLTAQHLKALVHPDYTDEEIRREVRHLGVSPDAATGQLRLEEKGTVYNEMVNYEAQSWRAWRFLSMALYGAQHPLARESGGLPADLRVLTPHDIRAFHDQHYLLGNMTLIAALPPSENLATALQRLDAVLGEVQPEEAAGTAAPARLDETTLPPPQPAPAGQIQIVDYPHDNDQQPGPVLLAWPGPWNLEPQDQLLLELFVATFGDGETSNLYKLLVDTTTRVTAVEISGIGVEVSADPGHPVILMLDGVPPRHMNEGDIGRVREVVRKELQRIAALPPGAPDLGGFNERMRVRLVERRRQLGKLVNSPPRFGYRDNQSSIWLEQLRLLDQVEGFRKSLTLKSDLDAIGKLLATGGNPWGEWLARWKLLNVTPYAVAARPSPELLAAQAREDETRLADELSRLREQYGLADDQETLTRFRAGYDATTAELKRQQAQVKLPPLPDTLPLTQDDPLRFSVTTARGRIPIVTSTFESATSGTVGLALSVAQVKREHLVYLALLPQLLTSVGLYEDGRALPYDEMQEQQRRDILGLSAGFASNDVSGRCELLVKGSGNDAAESRRAVEWMRRVLMHPNWRPENLPRLRDVVDEALSDLRQRTEGYPESWVDTVALAYRVQDRPAFLTTASIFTQRHAALRLRWLLKDAPEGAGGEAIVALLNQLGLAADGASREDLKVLLERMQGAGSEEALPSGLKPLAEAFSALPEESATLAAQAAADLASCLSDIPDATLAQDWAHLCRQISDDLATPPADALAQMSSLRQSLLVTGGARIFVAASSATGRELKAPVARLLGALRQSPAVRAEVRTSPLVLSRLREREPSPNPVFVGLMIPSMQSSVIMNETAGSGLRDLDQESLLRLLALNLFGGGGANSLFEKTWSAGLAYSNGASSDPISGRFSYYADNVPDLPNLVTFVREELRQAPRDPEMINYALVQAFWSRAAGAYEGRAERMAEDLADGVTPMAIRRFREALLAMRDRPGLADGAYDRAPQVYGALLPGPDVDVGHLPRSQYLVIGPPDGLDKYEAYLQSARGPAGRLHRLYPRDFWLTGDRAPAVSAPLKDE